MTVSANSPGGTLKIAVSEMSWVMVSVHGSVPLQPPPLQPVKTKPTAGVPVRVTTVPLA